MTENGSCSVLHDGNSFNAEIISGEDHRSYDVNMFYRSYHVDIVDTQKKYLRMRKVRKRSKMTRLSPRCRVSRENTCAERRSLGNGGYRGRT